MEKKTAHYRLATVQALVKEGKVKTTVSAVKGAAELGIRRVGIIETVLELESHAFYKSMTTHADHTLWQDVYHAKTPAGDVYLKLTVIDDVLIVSFKEL